jgi:predicted phosphodiesterase
MTRIGLLSDTHGWLDEAVWKHFAGCDEIWHAGDFGPGVLALLKADGRPLKGVYGNIDDTEIRQEFPEMLAWNCEGVRVFMQHIGGYPDRYAPRVKDSLVKEKARLFISGHSHILKVIYDPGAAGRHGWHQMRTILRFAIDGNDIKQCEVIELGTRGGI